MNQGMFGYPAPFAPSSGVPEGRLKSATATSISMPGVAANGGLTTQTQTSGRASYAPLRPLSRITVDQLVVEVTTAVAASTLRCAIYNADSDWQPTTLVVDSGLIDSSATGVKSVSIIPTILEPGLYLTWINASAAGIVTRAAGGQFSQLTGWNAVMGGNASIAQFHTSQAYGAPPSVGLRWDTIGIGTFNASVFIREMVA
jgi:hypothetical protein